MRKLIMILSLLTLFLTACGNSATAVSEQSEPVAETPVAAEQPASEPEMIESAPASPDIIIEAEPAEEPSFEEATEESAETAPEENVFDPASVDPNDFYSANGSEFDFDTYMLALGYEFMDFPKWENKQSGYLKPGQNLWFIYDIAGLIVYFEKDGLYYYEVFKVSSVKDDLGGPLMRTRQMSSYLGEDVTAAVIEMARYFAENSIASIDPANLPISIDYGGSIFSDPFIFDGQSFSPVQSDSRISNFSTTNGTATKQ